MVVKKIFFIISLQINTSAELKPVVNKSPEIARDELVRVEHKHQNALVKTVN